MIANAWGQRVWECLDWADLGNGVLWRCHIAFLEAQDRPAYDFAKYLPPRLTLAEAAQELRNEPINDVVFA